MGELVPLWTADTLKQHYDSLIAVRDREFHEHVVDTRREVDRALGATEKAVDKSERDTDRRFQAVDSALDQLRIAAAAGVQEAAYTPAMDGLSRRLSLTELNARDLLPRVEFAAYLDRQEDAGRERRRALSNSQVAVGIAILGALVTLFNSGRLGGFGAQNSSTTTPQPVYVVPAPTATPAFIQPTPTATP